MSMFSDLKNVLHDDEWVSIPIDKIERVVQCYENHNYTIIIMDDEKEYLVKERFEAIVRRIEQFEKQNSNDLIVISRKIVEDVAHPEDYIMLRKSGRETDEAN